MVDVRGRQWSGMVGRGVARSFGQITVSVVATLIATQIYSAMRRVDHGSPPPPVSMTASGKFDARIAGAELPPLPEPAKPVLSIVNWAITPLHPMQPMDDVAWSGLEKVAPQSADAAPPRAPRREGRHGAATPTNGVVALAAVPQASGTPSHGWPADGPRQDSSATQAVAAGSERNGLLAAATDAVISVKDLGGSVLTMGVSAVDRLLPGRR